MRGKYLGAGLGTLLWFIVLAGTAFGSFGFKDFSYSTVNQDGSAVSQAGSHPWALTTSFDLNATTNGSGEPIPDGDVKDTDVDTPLGLTGNPNAAPKCSVQQFTTPPKNKENLPSGTSFYFSGGTCPNNSQVGVAAVTLTEGGLEYIGVYNLEPPPGVPAEFGFNYVGEPVLLTAAVRGDGSYGLTVHARDISQTLHIFGARVTLWGVPADPSHDGFRGECLGTEGTPVVVEGGCPAGVSPRPFLTLPTSCPAEPPVMSIRADPWQDPGAFVSAESANLNSHGEPVSITGCNRLDFSPSLTIAPSTTEANAPTGLDADLSLPQSENPAGLAESHLRSATVTLPPGLVLNPSAADGREACSPAQVDLNAQTAASCPDASKVGSVVATTPLLEKPLEGSVYLAQQENNPFNSLLAIYIVTEGDGVHAKLAGQVHLDPQTGQLSATFDGNRVYGLGSALEGEPQLPFSDLKLKFYGGPRAALLTPDCGGYAASATLSPWSGTLPVSPAIAAFKLSSNCGGGFAPAFAIGTENNQAAAFSPLVTSISRGDKDQRLGRVSVKIPPGVLGMLSKVSQCGDAQAAAGACPASSQIGHLTASAGAGSTPVFLPQAGKQEDPVYLTGPYKGGPFGLAIVVHAEAGPFNLGQVVVRGGIYVDPHTTQITVITDPLPTILKGIPLDVRSATVTIDGGPLAHNQFIFNPTNCEPLAANGTVLSAEGAVATVSSHFQAANCAALSFKPAFKVSTRGQTSKKNGSSFDVKVTSGVGQANIGKVLVTLPKQLPARLTTLQKACTEQVFAQNPATCPAESAVGTATAISPVLNMPLKGPAYLVSHGGAGFPDLVVVLQGEGVRLDLVGNTNIKKGITISSFNAVPDAPITSFELNLPQGPHSALGTNLPASAKGNFCGTKLPLPVTLTGQNGAQLKPTVKIAVSGCPRARKAGNARRIGRGAAKAQGHR
ncbi:MAG TPA: hypothetical protein VIC06_01335 [Solirubrobacteraceae bacterium]|jgi:hypothetical protein